MDDVNSGQDMARCKWVVPYQHPKHHTAHACAYTSNCGQWVRSGRAIIKKLIVKVPHILYHSTRLYAATSAITALSLCMQSPLIYTLPLMHNKEYFNLLNSIHMGISLLIISDFECQSMTHAYYIRVNILITSVLALLYL